MNRYRNYGRLDDEPELIGDAAFQALDMRTDAALLGPGVVTLSENMRFEPQGAQVRHGIALKIAPGATLAQIRWVGIYRPEGDNPRLALVTETALVLFDPTDQSLTSYAYPGAETVASTDPVDFVQAAISSGTLGTAWILRGLAKTALKFDPASVGTEMSTDASFQPGLFSLFTQDRIAVASGGSTQTHSQEISTSDFLDFSTWSTLNQLKILYGGDDYLTGMIAYQKDYVIIAARSRFFIAYFAPSFTATGYDGNLNTLNTWLRDLTRQAGCVGRRALLEAAGQIWFLSDKAIYAFTPQLDNELTVLGDPISGPIEPILKNLNASAASGAVFQQLGGRIYCAMPINPDAVKISSIAISGAGPSYTATVTTETGHGLFAGDTVLISGTLTTAANGLQTVVSVTDATTFTYATSASAVTTGQRARSQKQVTRNNRIAVFNTMLKRAAGSPGEWESIDKLPSGLYADFLTVCEDAAGVRRLWIIDKNLGPAIYEEGDVDEVGRGTGGLRLQFRLTARLSIANFESVPIAGRIKSRTLRWGAFARHVRAGEARLTLEDGDAGTLTVSVRSPDRTEWISTRTFDDTNTDSAARKRCGKRGLEADLEVQSTSGRPVVRALQVEMTASGRVAEE